MKKVSKEQAKKNREMAKIKKGLSPYCVICGKAAIDPGHLLPRSTFPEYYTLPENIVPFCRSCHEQYDDDLSFRKKQVALILKVQSFDELAANRYFNL